VDFKVGCKEAEINWKGELIQLGRISSYSNWAKRVSSISRSGRISEKRGDLGISKKAIAYQRQSDHGSAFFAKYRGRASHIERWGFEGLRY
jgi:hypothetical protein